MQLTCLCIGMRSLSLIVSSDKVCSKSIIWLKSFKVLKNVLNKRSFVPWNSRDWWWNWAQQSNSFQMDCCYLGICVWKQERSLCWCLFIYRKVILRILARRISYFWHDSIKRFDEDVNFFSCRCKCGLFIAIMHWNFEHWSFQLHV